MEPRFERLETGFFAPSKSGLKPPRSMRILSWNINRGQQLDAVIEFLRDAKAVESANEIVSSDRKDDLGLCL